MIRFYSPEIEDTLTLPEGESSHCCRVLRKQIDDEIEVVDGKGHIYTCRIIDNNPRQTKLEIIKSETEIPESIKNGITIAIAPTKSFERMEWLVEKGIEIGVDRIVFIRCSRSERKDINLERIKKVAVAALKQSLKSKLPDLKQYTDFKSFLREEKEYDQKFMGYCSEKIPRQDFSKIYDPTMETLILIGPEGDFTEDEVKNAVDSGFIPVTFGKSRLRTETAGIYAITAVNVLKNQLIS